MSIASRLLTHLVQAIVLVSCCILAAAQTDKKKPITEDELAPWLNKQHDCPADSEIHFYRLDYYDFQGDGNQEAIVVASTCMTGTAGPDVHSVFGRDNSGEILELKVPEADKTAYDSLFGNSNSDLSVEKGLLVETFEDDAGRDTPPLIIKYKWNGKEFSIVSVQKTGIFKTSYDCAKADGETENAICHVKELADLDVRLGLVYKSVLANLSTAERGTLRAEQREWIAKRDKECVIYKGWIDCLSDCYQKRIEELGKRAATAPR